MRASENQSNRNLNSNLYFQLGLFVSLITVYFVVEHKTPFDNEKVFVNKIPTNVEEKVFAGNFKIEKEPKSEPKKDIFKPKSLVWPTFTNNKPVSNTTDIPASDQTEPEQIDSPIETKPEPTVVTAEVVNPSKYKNLWELDEKPTFSKCSGLKGLDRDKCFNEEMSRFLKNKLEYPEKEMEKRIEGTVFIQFVINTDGSISDVSAINRKNQVIPNFEKEAFRVIKQLPRFKPGMQGGKPVRVAYQIPIKFKLVE